MQAMVLEHPASIERSPLRLIERPDPEPEAGEVRIRVRCCAVCRTDLHIIEADLPPMKSPLVPGHQVVGEVDQLGPGCENLQQGQRVGIAWLRHTCGACGFCLRERENLCESSRYTGYHADGGFAQYAIVPEGFAYEIPDRFADTDAAPLLCAGIIGYRALMRANVPDGGTLLLVGFGSSAHIVIQLALHRGHEVQVVSRSPDHQDLARRMGAAWAGSDPADAPARAHSAILFAPSGKLLPPVLESLQKGGTVSIAGIHMTPVPPLDYARHLFYERDIRTVTANTRADGWALLAEASAAAVRPRTHTYALPDANRALEDMKHSRINGTAVIALD